MPIDLAIIAGYLDQAEVARRVQPLPLERLNQGRPSGSRRTLQSAPDFPVQRLHFYPNPETRPIIIGYIGKHLQTVNDPT